MREVDRYFGDNMAENYIKGMDATPDSVIIDLGAYKGNSAKVFSRIHNCRVYAFEPMIPFYNEAVRECQSLPNVSIFPYGLGKGEYEFEMSPVGDATSMYNVNRATALRCRISDFFSFLAEKNIDTVDMLHINIEGAEYDLLDYIFSKNFQTKIRHLVVQFHYPSAKNDANLARYFDIMSKTHTCAYDYKYVWTRWDLN